MPICSRCGAETTTNARFCANCGAPLTTSGAPPEFRKTVTVLFSDMAGSTSLGERLDPESVRGVMGRYFDTMRAVTEVHGGTVAKFIGDAVMAVFGIPVAHEDDAIRAVRAAADMRAALEVLNEELERTWGVRIQTRTGVNTGEVVAGGLTAEEALVVGDAVNVAARLEQHASSGEILLGETTYRLARHTVRAEPVPPLAVKGKEVPLPAHRLIEALPPREAPGRRLDRPLVGRAHEMMILSEAFERAVREEACHLFTVLGSAGVGKSRVTAELIAALSARATTLRGRCLPYGEGITFWPVVEILRDAAGIDDGDLPEMARSKLAELVAGEENAPLIAERATQLIGLAQGAAGVEEMFWAVRKLVETVAHRRPLVVLFEDIHWAEPTLLELIEHLADWSREAPILLLCTARPELLESRPSWGGGMRNATTILLEPLKEDESLDLIENLLEGPALPSEPRARIVEVAGGNPLFVEEIVEMLIDEGLLLRSDGHWEAFGELAEMSIPATISSLLTARLDRLPTEERRVIEFASVVGKEFWGGAVAALAPEDMRPRVSGLLTAISRKDLIRSEPSMLSGHDAFRFRHVLIRDAAYGALPRQARAELHEQFATWLERRFEDRLGEYEDILGYHLEEAYEQRAALGPVDDAGRALGARAGERLGSAGRRASGRGDFPGAVNLLNRAQGLLPAPSAEVLLNLGIALWETGSLRRAEVVMSEGVEAARAEGNRRLEWLTAVDLQFMRLDLDATGGVQQESREISRRAIEVFEALGDEAGLARAWLVMAFAHNSVGEHTPLLRAAEQAMEHAQAAGDERVASMARYQMASALTWGPTPVEEGLRRAEEVLARSKTPLLEGPALRMVAAMKALSGRVDEARALIARAAAIFRDLGLMPSLATNAFVTGRLEMSVGNPAAAERVLRESRDRLEEMGERGWLSTILAGHADALYELGRYEEAYAATERSDEVGASDDLATQIMWRSARAKVLARGDRPDEAEALAREAVTIADSTEGTLWQADAYLALGDVMAIMRRPDEEERALREALTRYEAKGTTIHVERVRHRLHAATEVTDPA
jgi:class 3 adenylate cyclase/tetratricopeptide (TPR) repeat protein